MMYVRYMVWVLLMTYLVHAQEGLPEHPRYHGSIGAYYQTFENSTLEDDLFGAENAFFSLTAVLRTEQALDAHLGIVAELSAWTRLSDTIALHDRVGSIRGVNDKEGGELTELYLRINYTNGTIRGGRMAIPGKLSPLVRTGKTAGVKDKTFDALMLEHTLTSRTLLYGLWTYRTARSGPFQPIGESDFGIVGAGIRHAVNRMGTLTAIGYYAPDFFAPGADAWAGALLLHTRVNQLDLTGQLTYVSGKQESIATEEDATVTASIKLVNRFGKFDAWMVAAYINDGGNPTTLAGGTGSLLGDAIDYTSGEGVGIGGGVDLHLGKGTLYLQAAAVSYADQIDSRDKSYRFAAIGYRLQAYGIRWKAEYKYLSNTETLEGVEQEQDNSRIRLQAEYRF